MKKILIIASLFLLPLKSLLGLSFTTDSYILKYDITEELPLLRASSEILDFEKISNVAHYKEADWSHVIGLVNSVSVEEAAKIARENPSIDYFFYVKGHTLVLENSQGQYRWFQQGDAIFFTGSPCWGAAAGLADGYMKTSF